MKLLSHCDKVDLMKAKVKLLLSTVVLTLEFEYLGLSSLSESLIKCWEFKQSKPRCLWQTGLQYFRGVGFELSWQEGKGIPNEYKNVGLCTPPTSCVNRLVRRNKVLCHLEYRIYRRLPLGTETSRCWEGKRLKIRVSPPSILDIW